MKKHDPHYIASVEKAVMEKYGKESIRDFRSDWTEEQEKQYLNELKQITKNEHRQKKHRPKQDRQCPVCKTYSFSGQDDLYMNRFQCCFDCYVEFIEHREERWQSGWRPTNEHIDASIRRRR